MKNNLVRNMFNSAILKEFNEVDLIAKTSFETDKL